jgi:radical SAM superfamily enzyme YgiQ (UPF0313 family)
MSHILLVNAMERYGCFNPRFEENMAFLYFEEMLKRGGYKCSFIDGMAYDLTCEAIEKEILNNLPSMFIGFTIYATNINSTINIIKNLRKEGYRGHITAGGMWASFKYRQILNQVKEIDSVCVGEGEELIMELSEALYSGSNLNHIKGLATRGKDEEIIFTPRKFKDNIDDLPVPDRRGYYLEAIKKKNSIAMLSSRGCHRKCSFCGISSYIKLCGGRTWRPRSPIAVVDEMDYLLNTTGVKNFEFIDDNFMGPVTKDKERYYIFAEEIIKRKLDIKFVITTRVDVIDYELFKKFKEAGLAEVNLGIESLSEEQLKRYNKNITLEENLRGPIILDRLNIFYRCFIIPMDPYVTRKEIIENLDRMEKHRPLDHFVIYNYFWMTVRLTQYLPLFERCLKDNLIRDFNHHELDNFGIRYVPFHPDVHSIIETANTIRYLHNEITAKVNFEGRKKRMPFSEWDRIEEKISNTLAGRLYKYLREYIDCGSGEDGKEFIYKKMNKTCENISNFLEKVKREDILEFKEYIIDIDGIKISTRPRGFNELVSMIMGERKNV